MNPEPKLSILLVSYNQERFIEECVNGILIQEYAYPFEVVVADDCSTDGTLEHIERMLSAANVDYRVLPTPANLGMGANYKRGFAACRGEYVAVLEGDDYWTYTRKLAEHTAFLDLRHECVMSFNRAIIYHYEGKRFEVRSKGPDGAFEYITTAQLAAGTGIGNMSTCVFRTSVIRRLDDEFWSMGAADWGYALALGQFGLIARLPGAMSVYRVHGGGLYSGRSKDAHRRSATERLQAWDHYLGYHFSREFQKSQKLAGWRRLRRTWRRTLRDALQRLAGLSRRNKA